VCTVKRNTDRAAELLRMPNCVPAPDHALCRCNRVRLGKSYTIAITNIKPARATEFLRGGIYHGA
jgi:hypothetical protein